jgi:O-antigen ligase
VSDPHQLFLLWAVEGGLLGMALLCATLLALWRYGSSLPWPMARPCRQWCWHW